MKAVEYLTIEGRFEMKRGHLMSPTVAYETWGTLTPAADNAVLIFTGLSPSAHAASSEKDPSAGWWEDMIGSGKPLDTDRYFIVCVNSLGSCFGSTGAASIDPATQQPYRLTFLVLTVRILPTVLQRLTTWVLTTVHSSSAHGRYVTLALPQHHPAAGAWSPYPCCRALLLAIADCMRDHSRNSLWQNGHIPTRPRRAALASLARRRSGEELAGFAAWHRIAEQDTPFGIDFEVNPTWKVLRSLTDSRCQLLSLSVTAMDLFDGLDHGGSLAASFSDLQLESALVIGVRTDALFPLSQQQELADALGERVPDVAFVPLDSIQGHDSFLVDMDRFRPAIAAYF